ncbi:MAG: hypothetical protein KH331_11565, partial [Subdoligranulum variabile]|nr:hypothetical protein [Subdoligranulum variabile]
PGGGGPAAGEHVLFIGKPRISQMNVHVHKAWQQGEALSVHGLIRWVLYIFFYFFNNSIPA